MVQSTPTTPVTAPSVVSENRHIPEEEAPLLSSRPTTNGTSNKSTEGDPNIAKHQINLTRGTLVVLGMAILVLINASNIAGMTVAQSTIAADLDAYNSTTWFTSILLTISSAFTPLSARLATIFSPAALVLPSACMLALGSLVSGTAPSLAVFLVGRAVLGVGSAGVLTLGMVLVLSLASPRRRGFWVGVLHTGYTGGVAIGAIVFGSLLGVIGWRAILILQAPLCLASGLIIYANLPTSLSTPPPPTSSHPHKAALTTYQKLANLDYLGAALLTSSFILLLSSMAGGSLNPFLLALSACTLALFLVVEFRFARDPIIPLTVLSSRSALFACLAQLIIMSARWTVLYFTPLIAIAVRGMHPSAAGSLLVPTNLGFSLGGITVGWIHVRHSGSYWASAIVSVMLSVLSYLALGPTSASTFPASAVVAAVFFNGFTTGAALTYTVAHTLHITHPDVHFVATSLLTTFRTFGGSFGTAIGGAVFFSTLRSTLVSGFLALDGSPLDPVRSRLVDKLMGSPALVFSGELSLAERGVAIAGYERAAALVFLSAAVLAVVSAFVQAGTGWRAGVGRV